MRDAAEVLGPPRDLLFVEASFLEKWLYACDVTVDIEHLGFKALICIACFFRRRNQTRAGIEERPLTIPITLFAGRARDYVVRCVNDCVNRRDIAKSGHRRRTRVIIVHYFREPSRWLRLMAGLRLHCFLLMKHPSH